MKSEEFQKQIDERCPCFAKPLSECDCEFDEDYGNCEECNTPLEISPDGWLCPKCSKEIYDPPFNSRLGS
jgi:hydrogenase maturation factor HypF (carbamoyltransferase family)